MTAPADHEVVAVAAIPSTALETAREIVEEFAWIVDLEEAEEIIYTFASALTAAEQRGDAAGFKRCEKKNAWAMDIIHRAAALMDAKLLEARDADAAGYERGYVAGCQQHREETTLPPGKDSGSP